MTKKGRDVELVSAQFAEHSGIGIVEYGVRLAKALRQQNSGLNFYFVPLMKSNIYNIPAGFYDTSLHTQRAAEPDIIHYLDPGFITKDLLRGVWRKKRAKLVVTIHDLHVADFLFAIAKTTKTYILKRPFFVLTSPFATPVEKIVTRYVVKKADMIICVSENTRDRVVEKYRINPKKCKVIYPIIDGAFKPSRKGHGNKKTVIGHFSSYLPNKNVEVLIRAFKKTSNKNLELHLYGSGMPFKIDDDKRIKYYGFILTEKIPSVLNSFDVFVFPSLWEGFGMPVMEAKRCKVPVITYAGAELPRIVKQNTLQFKDEDDLANMIRMSAWKKLDTKKAYSDIKKCKEDYVAKRIIRTYESLLVADKNLGRNAVHGRAKQSAFKF